jgi:hypothetical protein
MEFEDYQQVDMEQFGELILAIYADLKTRDGGLVPLLPGDPARGLYDTPFWNGSTGDDLHVCFGDACYKRSDVNYIAQGMWGAASGESLGNAIGRAADWKMDKYGEYLSNDTKYWVMFGYAIFNLLDQASP